MNSAMLDSLLAHIAILNKEGVILNTNKAWKTFNTKNAAIKRSKVGTNYFDILQQAVEMGNDFALKFFLGMKEVLKKNKDSLSLTYPLQTENNTFWFKLTLRSSNEEKTQFIMIHEDVTSSMQAKNKLQESQNRYQIQFEQSLEGILITDSNGFIIDANPAASDILGWNREELLGRPESELMDSEDSAYGNALQKRNETGTFNIEMNLIHKNDTHIPAEVSSRIFRNKNGKLHSIVTFRDISRRKQVERDLIKNRQFTESALNSNPGIFFVLDEEANLIPWNDNFVSNLGYSSEELPGKNVLDLVVEEHKPMVKAKIKECIEMGKLSVETKLYTADGQIRDYHIQANRFEQNGKVYIAGSGTDITESKEAELEIRKNQLMLEQLFENAPIGITIVDANNNIQQVNQSFENIFNYSQQEVVGKNINQLIVPDNKTDEANNISSITREGQSLQTESIRLTKDNQEVPVLIGGIPVELKDEVIAIYGMYADISEQAAYQQKIEQTLREKETLLAELHHRVKNNLALINSLLELQLFESEDPELKHHLSDVKKRIMTIASTHEVLYQNGNFNNIPIKKFIQELIDSGVFRNGDQNRKISINTDTDGFSLDIDQSIPCGLLLNELLSLIFNFSDKNQSTNLNIRLKKNGSDIHLIIEGHEFIKNPEDIKAHQSLHHTLIETLIKQLNGQLIWPTEMAESYQKFEFIFQKENGHSPARQILKN